MLSILPVHEKAARLACRATRRHIDTTTRETGGIADFLSRFISFRSRVYSPNRGWCCMYPVCTRPLVCMLLGFESMHLPPNVALFPLEDNQSSAKALEPTVRGCLPRHSRLRGSLTPSTARVAHDLGRGPSSRGPAPASRSRCSFSLGRLGRHCVNHLRSHSTKQQNPSRRVLET